MSTRDELAARLRELSPKPFISKADALIAEGWRKMPSREEIARAIASGLDGWADYDSASQDYKGELLSGADAVLALMEGRQ